MNQTMHKRIIQAWTMYDWANSTFVTSISATILPIYFASVAASTLPAYMATAYWGYTVSISLLIVAILSPILGTIADMRGAKKRFLAAFILLGVSGTALLFLVRSGDWLMACIFFILGNVGFAGSLVFYDALLPHIAGPDEIDQVSAQGFAMGYIGGGLLLAVNLAMVMLVPADLTEQMTRLTFLTVAVWWLLFSIPVLRMVPEPPYHLSPSETRSRLFSASLQRLGKTFRDITRYRDLFLFLLAFWLYNNGIGTIISMATIYGNEIGLGKTTLIGTLLMVQFLAAPFAFGFGWLAKRLGTKPSIFLSLGIYTCIAIGGYFMSQEWHFWALGAAVATVQGGSQALSRSLFGRLLPKGKSAEFFGFFSVSEKLSGIAGPAIFGFVSMLFGHSRLSIVSLVIFFIAGALLLTRVNEQRGIMTAQEEI